jgi:nitrous oxidase accessory protein NosD
MASRSRGRTRFGRLFSPRQRSASAVVSEEVREKRRQRRARKWRERFRRITLSSWQSNRIVQGVFDLFRSSVESARAVRAATGSQFVGLGNRTLRVETLEARQMLAADIWVSNNWALVADNGTPGVVDAGDIVRNDNNAIGAGTITKTYGINAFGVVTTGAATGSSASFDSINDAINAVDVAGAVHVLDGTYNELVQVNKPVSLLGAQSGVDARTRGVVAESIVSNGDGDFQILANNVVIDGFKITGVTNNPSDPPFTGLGAGIWANPAFSGTQGGYQLLNNVVTGNIIGLYTNNGSLPSLVQHNLIDSNTAAGPSSGAGIYMFSATSAVTIDANKITNNSGNAISIQAGPGDVTGLIVSNNEMNNAFGVSAYGITNSVFDGNKISTTDPGGATALSINGGSSNVEVRNSTLTGNARGLRISNYYGPQVSNISAHHNDLTGNSQFGLVVITGATTDTVDASSNYFGTSDPTVAATKISMPDGNVDFTTLLDNGDSDLGTIGFQADLSSLTVHTQGAQTGAVGRIQEGVNDVTAGGTVHVLAGTYIEDVNVNKTLRLLGSGVASTTISGAIGGSGSTIAVAANNVEISGFKITREGNNSTDWNNPGLNSVGISIQGPVTGANIHDNFITQNRSGIDINNSSGHSIHNNQINDNRTGLIFRNQTDNMTVVENEIKNNWTVGIVFLDGSVGTNSPVQTAANSTFSNNDLSGNWYGQIVDRQTGGSLPAPGGSLKNFSGNWFGTTAPTSTTANSSEPGYAAQIPSFFPGGSATAPPPGTYQDILGPASANFDISPFLAFATDTNVETTPGRGTYGFQGRHDVLIVTPDGAQTGAAGKIQEGINSVDSGGTVKILAGSYSGNVDATAKSVNLSPGASPAQVTVAGNVALTSDDTVTIEINGTSAANQYDNFLVDGNNGDTNRTIALGGATLALSGTYTPVVGDSFTIFNNDGTGDAVTGTFAGLAEGSTVTLNGVPLFVSYVGGDGNDVTLSLPTPSDVWVNDTWIITNDVGPAGFSFGDTVMSNAGAGDDAVAGKIFGYNAFATINTGLAAVPDSTLSNIHVLAGSYTGTSNVNKSVNILGEDANGDLISVNAGSSPGVTIADDKTVHIDNIRYANFGFAGIGIDVKGTLNLTNSQVSGGLIGVNVDGSGGFEGHLTMSGTKIINSTVLALNVGGDSGAFANVSHSEFTVAAGATSDVLASDGTVNISTSSFTTTSGTSRGVLATTNGDITVSDSNFAGVVGTVAVTNATAGTKNLNAAENYWGTTVDASVLARTEGDVDITPYLDSATELPAGVGVTGFDGDLSHLHVTTLGIQIGATGRVQEGINDIVDGALTGGNRIVDVSAGTYFEQVVVDRSVKILGANAAADPTDGGARVAESIIKPSVAGASPYAGTHTTLITVKANDVTLKGLLLDGENTALGAGTALTNTASTTQAMTGIGTFNGLTGVDVSVYTNIPTYAQISGLTVENNIVRNLAYQGIDIGFGGNGAVSGNSSISNNLIRNIGAYNDEGTGIRLYDNVYAEIANNDLENVRMGVETGNFRDPNPGSTKKIEGNEIQARRRGVFYNLMYGSTSPIPVENNVITATADGAFGASLWTGVYVITQQGTVTALFNDNQIDGSGSTYATTAGYTVLATDATSSVTISGDASPLNSISNVSYGVWETNVGPNGFGDAGANMNVTLSGLKISASTYGVFVDKNAGNGNLVAATINNNTDITTGGLGTAIFVSGVGASATITGNNGSIHGNLIGIDVNGGSASITNNHIYANTTGIRLTNGGSATAINSNNFEGGAFADNGTDLRIDSNAGLITGGVMTGNTFAGSTYYIDQQGAQDLTALRTLQIPPGTNNYNVAGVATSNDFTIEGRVYHQVDNASSGLVTWVANTIFVPSVGVTSTTPTTTDNDYTRIANALAAASDNYTIELLGTFNWGETKANASWKLGNNAIDELGGGDDYWLEVPAGLDGVTFTSGGGLGSATIMAPGDDPNFDQEGALVFFGGDNQNWTISELEFEGLDLSIAFFNGAGGSDAFQGTKILHNHIVVPGDAATASDVGQNIGIHYSFGKNQVIQDNIIDLRGDSVSAGSNFSSNVGMQSNTSGGDAYDGLLIDNNTINVYGAQDAANPAVVLGIWENGHAHNSDITISNNDFINHDAGNNPVTNLQRAFRVTSHSSGSTTVQYTGNTVAGANIGFQWLAGSNFTGNQAIELTNNVLTNVNTGILVQSNGLAHLSGNSLTNSGTMLNVGTGLDVASGSIVDVDGSPTDNTIVGFATGIRSAGTLTVEDNDASIHGNLVGIDVIGGTATITNNHIYDNGIGIRFTTGGSGSVTGNNFNDALVDVGDDNDTDLKIDGTAGAVTIGAANKFAGNTFFIDNQSTQSYTLTGANAQTYDESNNYRIEDKMHHRVDTDLLVGNGLITWVSGNVYVTDAGTDHSIQRGHDAASAGDTVNVEGGTYVESVTINKAITIDGDGSGPSPLATITAALAGATLINVAATNPSDDVFIRDLAFLGVNGATVADIGVNVPGSANFNKLEIERSTFTDLHFNGVQVLGNNATGASAQNVVIDASTFTNNGFNNGGAGDIDLFRYNKDATLSNLTLSNDGTLGSRFGIQLRGKGNDLTNGTDLAAMGTVSLSNIGITGKYRTQFIGIQDYTDVSNLSFTNVVLGGATSEITGGFGALLRFDAVGTGTLAAPKLVNLGNTYFRGTSLTSATKNDIEFAPDNTFAFLRADATNTKWDVVGSFTNVLASALTTAQAYDVEDRILHYVDPLNAGQTAKGWAEIQNGQSFVTATFNSSISRAAEVVDAGGTVHIKSGTYTGNVSTSTNNVTLELGSSPGQVTINGNVTLDANDTLHMEINGLTAGSQYDQLVVNGTVDLGGAALSTTGSTIVASNGQSVEIIDNDDIDPVTGTFLGLANGATLMVNSQLFEIFYNGGTGNDVILVKIPTGPPPSVVFVDDSWAGYTAGTDADFVDDGIDGVPASYTAAWGAGLNGSAYGYDQFSTIQAAINAVGPNGTIYVYSGTYSENLLVNKSVTLLGANNNVSGDGLRDPESLIHANGNTSGVVTVTANNVTISGFTVSGDDPSTVGQPVYSGADANAFYAITNGTVGGGTPINGLTVRDNIIQRAALGVLGNGNAGGSTTSVIDANMFQDIGVYDFGYAISLRDNFYANITNNVMRRVYTGIHVNNFSTAKGSPWLVQGNDIESYANGLWHNQSYSAATAMTLDDNDFSTSTTNYLLAPLAPVANNIGILVTLGPGGIAPTVTNNTIDDQDYGVVVWGTPGGLTLGSTNSITDSKVGVYVTNNVGFNPIGTTSLGLTATASTVTLDGISISNSSTAGVLVRGDAGGGAAQAIIQNDTNIVNVGHVGTGIQVSGPNASATVQNNDNSIHGFAIGIDVNGGSATITNNHIYDNTTGIRFTASGTGSVTNDDFNGPADATDNGTDLRIDSTAGAATINDGNDFGGNTYFIDNRSTQTFDLSSYASTTYEGLGAALSPAVLADDFRIEDRMYHATDDSSSGRIRVVSGKLYVTAPGTGASDETIQLAVNAADPGDTIHVEAGLYQYTSSVNVNKQVTLLGAQAGVDARTRSGAESIIDATNITSFPDSTLAIASGVSGVVIDGFTVQNVSGSGAVTVGGIYMAAGSNSTTVRNNIIKNNHAGIFVENNTPGVGNATVIEQNLFMDNQAAGAASGNDIYADESTSGGGLQNVVIQNNKFTNTSFVLNSWAIGMSNTGATAFSDIDVLTNTIENHGRGMYFYNSTGVDISGSTITGATRYGIGIFGYNGVPANSNFTITGNTLNNNGKGIYVEADTAANAYTGGTLTLSGNAYTTSGSQISIYNDSNTPIDATADIFNTVLASGASTAQQYVIVDTIVDAVDIGAYATGLVRTKAGNVYVTPNSFFDDPGNGLPFTQLGTTTADIQRAVDAATSGNTVHIASGSYTGSVATSGKSLTLEFGASPGQVTVNGNVAFDGDDTLHFEINGTTPTYTAGTDFDQLIVTGTVSLGGVNLSTAGSTISAAQGDTLRLIDNQSGTATLPGTFAGIADGDVILINGQPFFVNYDGGTGNDVVISRAPNGFPVGPPAAPNVVFVDDNWNIFTDGLDADYLDDSTDGVPASYTPVWGAGLNGYAKGYDEFDNIQAAIDAVASGGTIYVYAGDYVQSITIDKSLTMKGAQATVDARTRSGAESTIRPDTSDANPFSAGAVTVVTVDANNVTIDGFTVDGDNTALPDSGVHLNGATIDAATGIGSFTSSAGATVTNNIVRNTSYTGVDFENLSSGAATSGNLLNRNKIENLGDDANLYGYGLGVLVGTNFYADVKDNLIQGVRVGVQTDNFYNANPGLTGSISTNEIHARRAGIWNNLSYSAASGLTISDNDVFAESAPLLRFSGIWITSIDASANPTIANNDVTMGVLAQTQAIGYEFWNDTAAGGITLTGGSTTGGTYGVWVNNFDSYPTATGSNGGSTTVTINGLDISNASAAGVYVKDNPSNSNSATVHANIQNDTNILNCGTGILITGADAGADVLNNDNSIHGNLIGIDVNGGSATITNNHIYDNGTGIRFTNSGSGSVTGNDFNDALVDVGDDNDTDLMIDGTAGAVSIGAANKFAGNTFFIDNQSTQSYTLTGANAQTYDESNNYRIEDKMHHRVDTDLLVGNGLITWVSNNVYITQPVVGSTDSSIQRGVNALSGGQIVNVEGGALSYIESVTIDRAVTIDGEGSGPTPSATITAASSGATLINVTSTTISDDITIKDIAFEGINGASVADIGVNVPGSANFNKLEIERSTFTDLHFNGVQVLGNNATGASAQNVVIDASTFTNNGFNNGGAGDIDLFRYNKDATLSNLTLSNDGTLGSRFGIQLRGKGNDLTNGTDLAAMGTVSLSNIGITGKYRTQFIGIQDYTDVSNLSFTNVVLGGATSEITGGFGALLRFDAVGTGTLAAPKLVNLGNTYFRGTSLTSATKNDIEFAPDNTFAFLRADATNTKWDVVGSFTNVLASALTTAQAYDVEDRILHYVDPLNAGQTAKGWAEIKNGNAYVTATFAGSSIQRAVDVVDDPGVVHVKAGSYTGSVSTAGKSVTLSLGASPAQVNITGNLTLDSNDTLLIDDVNGTSAATQYDNLVVSGSVSLGGATLSVPSLGYSPAEGDTLDIINGASGSLTGTFGNFAQGDVVIGSFRVNYNTTDGDVELIANTTPLADAGGPYTISEGNGVILDASGSYDPDVIIGDSLTYEWDIDNNGSYDFGPSASPTLALTWAQLQSFGINDGLFVYTVKVRVTDELSASDVDTASLTVNNTPPTISLSGATDVNEGGLYSLTLGPVVDPGADTVTNYAIHWGDGITDNYTPAQISTMGGVVTHTYVDDNPTGTLADLNTISVDLTDEDGTFVAGSKNITVHNLNPTAITVNLPSINEGSLGTLTVTSVTDPGIADTFTYSFIVKKNGATYATSGGFAASNAFSFTPDDMDPGFTWTVDVQVKDDDGGVFTEPTHNLTVVDVAPTVNITARTSPINENTSTSLTFNLVDPGAGDVSSTIQVVINWADSSQTIINGSTDPAALAALQGGGSVTKVHTYVDDNPPGTSSDIYSITFDSIEFNGIPSPSVLAFSNMALAGGSLSRDVTVTNVAPTGVFVTTTSTVNAGDPVSVNWLLQNDQSPNDVPGLKYTYFIDVNNNGFLDGGDTLFTPAANYGDGTYAGSTSNSAVVIPGSYFVTPGVYKVGSQIRDDDNGVTTQIVTVTVNPSTFKVSSIAWNSSGFHLAFNRAADPDEVNLYNWINTLGGGPTAGNANLSAVDLVVTGPGGSAVNGSLIWDTTYDAFDWVKTGGALAAGNYSVTLVSGNNRFEDMASGEDLDGNFDNVPGGNYTSPTNTVVIPAGTRTVSIPDFSRGASSTAGQSLRLPYDNTPSGLGIPVTIDNGSGVTAVDFQLEYDAALLDIPAATPVDSSSFIGLPAGWTATVAFLDYGATSGTARINVSLSTPSMTPLPSGLQQLVRVAGSIRPGANYGASEVIKLNNLQVNEGLIGSRADFAVHKAVFVGDADQSGAYDATDASLISGVAVDNAQPFTSTVGRTGFRAYPITDPVIVGDVTRNGSITGLDASWVSQKSIYVVFPLPAFNQPEIPDYPAGVISMSSGFDPTLDMDDLVLASAGSTVVVPIRVTDSLVQGGNGVFGFTVGGFYDTTKLDLTPSSFTLGSVLTTEGNWGFGAIGVDDASGTFAVTVIRTNGQPTTASGTGPVVNVAFDVKPSAPSGVVPVTVSGPATTGGGSTPTFNWTYVNGSILVDATPPVVNAVRVGSSAWTNDFRHVADAGGLDLGYIVQDGANQLLTLPWTNINQVMITFSEDVVVGMGDLVLHGVNTADYTSLINSFSYNPGTRTATWGLSSDLLKDKFLAILSDNVKDTAGNALDGDWTNGGDSYPSGNGSASGNLQFRFNVLPGDADRSGAVLGSDVGEVRNRQFQAISGGVPSANYTIFDDLDGSGAILGSDVGAARNRQFDTLPGGEPGAGSGAGLESLATVLAEPEQGSQSEWLAAENTTVLATTPVAPTGAVTSIASAAANEYSFAQSVESVSSFAPQAKIGNTSPSLPTGLPSVVGAAVVPPTGVESAPLTKATVASPAVANTSTRSTYDLALLEVLDSQSVAGDEMDDYNLADSQNDKEDNADYADALDSVFDGVWAI